MDDVTLGGPCHLVANYVSSVIAEGTDIGWYLNIDKSELITKPETPVNLSPID